MMNLELKKRLQKISYTLKHKKAFLEVERKLRGNNTISGYLHDLDKPFLYLCPWLELKEIQTIHRNNSKHHVKNNLNKTKDDLLDTIIDWECARLTKPDKPLNAYQTLMKFYPEYEDTFLPLIKEYLPYEVKEKSSSHQMIIEHKELYFRDNRYQKLPKVNQSQYNHSLNER